MAISTADAALVQPRVTRGRALRILAVFVLLAAVAFDRGGYFPEPWGWTIVAAAWAIGAALALRRDSLIARPAMAVAWLLAAFTGWTLLSSIWSLGPTQTALETQRMTVYAAVFLAVALWVRRSPGLLLIGTWAAISVVCSWSLLTRLVPDRWGVDYVGSGNRLTSPVGYWNSLAIFAAAGAILALALASEASSRLTRALAAATLPLLVVTLYFTYSRGAWLCLGIGLLTYVVLSARRTRLVAAVVALAPWSVIAVWRASVAKPLTVSHPALGAAAHDGHRLILVLLGLAACSAAAAFVLAGADARLELPPALLLPARLALVAVAILFVIAGIAHYGSPSTVAHKAWHSFASRNDSGGNATLNGRLFSFSGSGRVAQWRVAWQEAKAHPVIGSGARTYEIYWNRLRTKNGHIRDVHNLYLQTLAELGLIGLVTLLGALVIPLATGVAARKQPLIAATLGAYVAYLLHAIVDWDWEITGVMLPFLVCAAVLTSTNVRRVGTWGRRIALAAAVVFGLAGVYTIVARLPLDRLNTALAKQQWAKATSDAHDASDLAPWSSEPWLALGEAELANGLTPQAQDAFRRAVKKDRNNWVAWWDLARATQNGERQDALLHVKQLNPRAPKAD